MPGLLEAGWDYHTYRLGKEADERSFEEQCREVIDTILHHENGWPFKEPVDKEKVKDYYDMVKNPIDLESIKKKLANSCNSRLESSVIGGNIITGSALEEEVKVPKITRRKDTNKEDGNDQDTVKNAHGVNMDPYTCMSDFKADIKLMFDNARLYNKPETIYFKYAE